MWCGPDLGKAPKSMVQAIVRDCWRVTAEEEITKQNRSKRLGIYFHLSPHLFKEGCYSCCKRTHLKVSLAWVLDHCYAWYLGNIFPLTSRYSHTMTLLKSFIKSAALGAFFFFFFYLWWHQVFFCGHDITSMFTGKKWLKHVLLCFQMEILREKELSLQKPTQPHSVRRFDLIIQGMARLFV